MRTFKQHIDETFNSLADVENKWKDKFDTLWIGEYPNGDIEVSSLIIARENRKQGVGSSFMEDLCDYADQTRRRILLSPGYKDDNHGTTSHTRLIKFYKRFDFVQNKGRNKDYHISHTMIRNPQ